MKMTLKSTVEAVGLTKSFGKVNALQDVSMSLREGECLALVGHNGAGKSTLIKIILGLIEATSGKVDVLGKGHSIKSKRDWKRKTGFLPEQILFQKNMPGREALTFYARLKRAPLSEVEELFERVNLLDAIDNRIGTYSKGMRQRLGMAQALLGKPDFLVLDEPTSGLDPVARQNIYKILDEEKRRGTSILISSHVLTEIDERVDRIVILNSGKVVADGTLNALCQEQTLQSKLYIEATAKACDRIQSVFSHELPISRLSDNAIILQCDMSRKVLVLNSIYALGMQLSDIRITDPSLEDVFGAYMHNASGARHD